MLISLLSLIVVPHGITDIILSYETDTISTMLFLYFITPLIYIYINNYLYKIFFLASSIIHFSHDSYYVFPLFIIFNYIFNKINFDNSLNYMVYYLSFIHVPIHYSNIFLETNYLYQHICIIIYMTIISSLITPYLIDWIQFHSGCDILSKFIGGIIVSHIYFNEYLNLSFYNTI
jgi:hypothetical protein